MIESFTIENYRSFQQFKLSQLGRVNLLVGENNSGKTSILEAINLFFSYPNFIENLAIIFDTRGDFAWKEVENASEIYSSSKNIQKQYKILNLFNNLNNLKYIHLTANLKNKISNMYICFKSRSIYNLNQNRTFVKDLLLAKMNKKQTNEQYRETLKRGMSSFDSNKDDFRNKIIKFLWNFQEEEKMGGINIDIDIDEDCYFSKTQIIEEDKYNGGTQSYEELVTTKIYFIYPSQQNIKTLIDNFDAISLTPSEDIVIDALKIIDPRIKRIATSKSIQAEKSNFKVLLENEQKPISLSTMGDGIWQLLTIILAMVNNQNGIVLIDEIDTGLHFTTLLKMWELIIETSKKLNVQVFATTHNSDCWTALGEFIEEKKREDSSYLEENEVTLHRIEAGNDESILFDTEDIVIATNNDIEVR